MPNDIDIEEESFAPPRLVPKPSEISTSTSLTSGTQEKAHTHLKPPKQTRPSPSGFFFPRVVALDAPNDDDVSFVAKQRFAQPMTLVVLSETSNHVEKHPLDQQQTFQQQQNDCQPILNVSTHPTCNSLHELDFVGHKDEDDSSWMIPISLLSMSGTWRSVWRVDVPLYSELQQVQVPVAVLKVLLWKRNYTEESFAMHALDARTMEQLTASPHVVDIYSFCGQSQLSEFGNNARLGIKDRSLHAITRLRMARDLAEGLADLHAYRAIHDYQRKNQSDLPAVFAHHDINLANLVRTNRTNKNGVSSNSAQNVQIKWNDFNLGIPLRQYRNGTVCPIPVRHLNPLWRSPEEIQSANTSNTGGAGAGVDGAQADIYSFGSLLFLLVARHQPWWHLEPKNLSIETIMQQKMAGEMPHMPRKYIATMEATILWEAIQACYRLDPQTRPTAYELAQAIGTAYKRIRDNKNKKPITIESVRALFKKRTRRKKYRNK